MKKLIGGLLIAVLLGTSAPAHALNLEVISRTISNTAATISATNKSGLASLLRQNPVANRLTCTGLTKVNPTAQEKSAALTKAKSFCSYAKLQKSGLLITSNTKPTATKANVGRVSIALAIPNSPTTPLTFDTLDVNWVARAATTKVLERFESSSVGANKIDYLVGPTVPASGLAKEKSLIESASRLWSAVFTKSFTVVLFSEKDADWAEQNRLELGGDLPGGISGYLNRPGAKDQCILGFASTDKRGNPIYFNCIHSSGNRYSIADHTAIHEHFHMVQNSIYKPNSIIPLWVNEGAPTFFGFALGYGPKDRNGRLSEQFYLTSPLFDPFSQGTADATRFANWTKSASDRDIVRVFELLEQDPENRDALNQYGLGAIAAQALIAVKGIDPYLAFIKATNQMDWKLAFFQNFGLTPADFYQKLVPYVRSLGKKYL